MLIFRADSGTNVHRVPKDGRPYQKVNTVLDRSFLIHTYESVHMYTEIMIPNTRETTESGILMYIFYELFVNNLFMIKVTQIVIYSSSMQNIFYFNMCVTLIIKIVELP